VRLGDLSLCECLFFLAYDPFTGKPRIAQDMLDIGLAGAALGDLLFDERITLSQGTVVLTSRYATGDPTADRTLAAIMGEMAQLNVRTWLEHLRDKTFATVVGSLTDNGLITLKENRAMFRRSTAYPPTDLRVASEPRSRIRKAVLGRQHCGLPTATLALLAWTIGLDDICAPDLNRRQMAEWTEQMKNMTTEPIAGLISGVEGVVAATSFEV
jgi:hypothetical protein